VRRLRCVDVEAGAGAVVVAAVSVLAFGNRICRNHRRYWRCEDSKLLFPS
jgi:hypothetical protein